MSDFFARSTRGVRDARDWGLLQRTSSSTLHKLGSSQ